VQNRFCGLLQMAFNSYISTLVQVGRIYLDFTLSKIGDKVKDHGFLWRIPSSAITDLYLWSDNECLNE